VSDYAAYVKALRDAESQIATLAAENAVLRDALERAGWKWCASKERWMPRPFANAIDDGTWSS
jgi:hypothetical protein